MSKGSTAKIFLVVLLAALFLLLRLFWTYFSAIVLALLISNAFYPLYSRVKRLFKGREHSSALFMSLSILLVLILLLGGFVGTLSTEALQFYGWSRDTVSLLKIQEVLEGDSLWALRVRKGLDVLGIKVNPKTIEQFAASLGRNVGLYLSRQISSVASNLLSFLVHFFLMMLVIYYVLRDGDHLKAYITGLLPFPARQQNLMVNKFREMARAIIFGNGINGMIQGILGGVGFFAFGLGSPFLWGTVIGFMAFLPIIGASVVFVPATVLLLIQGKQGLALGYLLYNGCYSSIMEYFVKPRLIGKGMRMNPLLVFIGIIGGMKLFGILGIVYGPLIITVFLSLAEIYRLEYKDAAV